MRIRNGSFSVFTDEIDGVISLCERIRRPQTMRREITKTDRERKTILGEREREQMQKDARTVKLDLKGINIFFSHQI